MARRTKEDAQKTRKTIIDAAVRVFSAKGIARTTLMDIAKEARVTRGAIYWHFKNKEDLLNVLWDDALSPFDAVRHALEDPREEDLIGALQAAQLEFFRELYKSSRRQQMFKILFYNGGSEKGSVYQIQRNHFKEGQEMVTRVLASAVERGQLAESFDVRLGAMATIVFVSGLTRKCIMLPDEMGVENEIPALLEGLSQMLRTAFQKS